MSELPTKVGKYKVVAKLGQGGMAQVLLCLSHGPGGFNKLLVLKQLREELAAEDEFLTMFLDEARLAARLNHPNVVHTYEVGEADGRHFIAMDYLEGQPFNRVIHRVKRAHIPVEVYVPVLAETLAGLHYAHELTDFDGTALNVVHRDVSPHNIFVTYDGEVKLVDFGIAKAVGAASVTREGVFKGKIRYMAPEQAQLQALDRRADIYAVGVILWECLTGRRINTDADDQLLLLKRRMDGDDPPVLEVNPEADAKLAALCDRAMAPDPDARYATALEFQTDLEDYMDAVGIRGGKRGLAKFMQANFEADRNDLAQRIEKQVSLHEEQSSVPVVDLETIRPSAQSQSQSQPLGQPQATPIQTSREVSASPTAMTAVSEADESGSKGRSTMLMGAAALALVGLGGALAATSMGSGEAPASAPATSEPTSAKVDVVVTAQPAQATITVDGADAGSNPFRAQFDKGPAAHRIRVAADGFTPVERMVVFDRDQQLEINLVAIEAVPTATASTSAEVPEPDPPSGRPVVVRPVVPPPAQPAEPPSQPSPKKPAPPTSRPIDESNPYQ